MALGQHHISGAANAFHPGRSRSQSTNIRLPAPSPPKKRASSYYPARGTEIVDESNPDPFYLEHSLSHGAPWGSCRRDMRDARYSDESHPYFMLSNANPEKEFAAPPVPRAETARSRPNINRSTLSVLELEHQLGLQQAGAGHAWSGQPCHSSHGSFSSIAEDTPDLTPSSSFSSNYSSPLYVETTKPRPLYPAQYLPSSTPLHQSFTALPTRPSSSSNEPRTPVAHSNASSDTLVMAPGEFHDAGSLRGKPLPSVPPVPRIGNPPPGKRPSNPPARPPIEASMISAPCRINPVTLEPHTTHFDQALFIPANDCPSPVPSPTPSPGTPSMEQQRSFGRDRPSTSTSEMYCGEQSVWESDSDNEDADPKSLRKPMDTLKKVRSRVHLRVAKSAPKLQNSQHHSQSSHKNSTSQELERFPSIPDHALTDDLCPPPSMAVVQARSSKDIFRPPTAHQTLRLVAPSTTSLVRPRTPRSRGDSTTQPRPHTPKYDIGAAAIQAQSRRRQRSESPELPLTPQREKLCTLCREERSDRAIQQSLSLVRPPLYKRFWESLRVLGCHGGDISPPRHRKPM
ncbi:hypothetical protein FE257_000365 [Aspergillus nanangensis]|uniref:Uncharacterized protein n=1 Tax=Aspergillus nanangensis TaxID=2582783 RepID=A0AAD4CUG9_ASPNN|nr:hypothetical protein FE257_000365 [Aspergillus nanangensis]